jgi:hypothetical protein
MKNNLLFLCLIVSTVQLFGQQQQVITAGPVVGGVSQNGARIYIQTASPIIFDLQIGSDSLFNTVVQTYTDSTRFSLYGGITVNLNNLQPNTGYYYRFLFNGSPDVRKGQFKTFPIENVSTNLKIALGSCNYVQNDHLYQHLLDFEPQLFLHLGDWNWPPAQFGNELCLHPDLRAASFASRYNDVSMRQMLLPNCPIDYIYDDDFSWNDGEATTYPLYSVTQDPVTGAAITTLTTVDMPNPGIREGAIKGYFDHFPAYPAVDTAEGIYHSFKIGNVEIFMLDCRNNRDARHHAFVQDPNTQLYSYQPNSQHTMLGDAQREWLINGLKNSTADWKLVGSSVIFNKNYGILLDVGLQLQQLFFQLNGQDYSGAVLASQMSYNWIGYPLDQDTILSLSQNGQIRDVIMMSGDSHSNMIDDGTNSGLPEISASGIAANNEGSLNYFIDQYAGVLGFSSVQDLLWNGGGNGVNNNNFNDGFGTIEVFGKDSIRLCVRDEYNVQLGCKTIIHSSIVSTENPTVVVKNDLKLFPNPANDILAVQCEVPFYKLRCFDLTGRSLYDNIVNGKNTLLNLSNFSNGLYLIHILDKKNQIIDTAKFIKQ